VVADHVWAAGSAPVEGYSVTKSITSLLVGIAQDRGLLDLDDPATTYIPEWAGTPSAEITVRDLLANTSGRQWDLRTDYVAMAAQAQDKTGYAIGLGQDAPPGEVWAYNNSAIQTLDRVLEEATGQEPAAFAQEVLFEPLGMTATSLTRDPAGNTLTFMGVQTTCADLARIGQLVLQDGRWGDDQVVSSAYLAEALSPSSDLNDAYGLLWWLNREGTVVSPTLATGRGTDTTPSAATQVVPGAPEDLVWALGLGNQILMVDRADGVVAVRLGERPPDDRPFGTTDLTIGVLDALQP
jgi:CubicO group peptidase (beta-lactamase class C family)